MSLTSKDCLTGIGFVCSTAIVVTMLLIDGPEALVVAGTTATALGGLSAYQAGKQRVLKQVLNLQSPK